jgi:putative DNA primase/helicase
VEIGASLEEARSTLKDWANRAPKIGEFDERMSSTSAFLRKQFKKDIDAEKAAAAKKAKEPPPAVNEGRPLTDLWTARLLVERYGEDIRYAYDRGKWFIWDGCRYAIDETGQIDRLAKETINAIYRLGADASGDCRKNLLAHASKTENTSRIRSVLELARSERGVAITTAAFDCDLWLFNVENGTIDLRSGEIREHRRDDLITMLSPVAYDPAATSPRFDAFLRHIFAENRAVIDFLQRAVGYSLTGVTREQVFFILWGGGANGKTTLVKALMRLFADYAKRASISAFMERRDDKVRNDLARLAGARFVAAVEAKRGGTLDETVIKELTGEDPFVARFLFHEEFEYLPQMKIWLATNYRPKIHGTDEAIWRRPQLLPFDVTIPKEQQDKELAAKLYEELPGILAWAVSGCLRWQAEGLNPPDDVRAAVKEYRHAEDHIGHFIDEECEVADIYCVTFGALYEAYRDWCSRRDEEPYAENPFARQLTARRFEGAQGTGGVRMRFGICLKDRGAVADRYATSDNSRTRG